MTTPDPSPACPQERDRRWWVKMSVASAVLVALAVALALMAPSMALHWHAWRYRTRRDETGDSLKHVVDWAVRCKASRGRVVAILGPPTNDVVPGGAGKDVANYYLHSARFPKVGGFSIQFRDGKATSASPIPHGPPSA